MLAHPQRKEHLSKKTFKLKKNNKKIIFFLLIFFKNKFLLDKLNFSKDDQVRDLDRFPLNNFKFF